jgi:Fur family ferric uptake transcriptional regulator
MARRRTDSEWVEEAYSSLREAGYRTGGARSQVVELLGSEDCALSALEMDRRLDRVGRASVYRTLEQLEGLRLVQRVDLGGDAAGYERVSRRGHHHHHVVCQGCGKVLPFEDPGLERAIRRVASKVSFDVAGHEVTLRGSCPSCKD